MARLLDGSRRLALAIVIAMCPPLAGIAGERGIEDKPTPMWKQSPPAWAQPTDPALVFDVATADLTAGEAEAALCTICHTLQQGAADLVGPNLFDIVGAPIGGRDRVVYSPSMRALNEAGAIWTLGFLDLFLASPATVIPGTRMGFVGIADERARINLIAYLRSLSNDPVPLAPVGSGDDGLLLAPLTFTEQQVDAGRNRYFRAECADCHAANLAGVLDTREDGDGDGPALTGRRFVERWFGGPVSELFRTIVETMPPERPGTLDLAQYADLVAFILAENGFRTGDVPLPTDPDALAGMGFYQ